MKERGARTGKAFKNPWSSFSMPTAWSLAKVSVASLTENPGQYQNLVLT